MTTLKEVRNGYKYEIIILDDENHKYKILVNYVGFNQHFVLWFSNDLNDGIDKAIEELHKNYPFEQLIFEYK